MKARSGMNAPAGTPLNTLDRTSQTEYSGTLDCAGAVGTASETVNAARTTSVRPRTRYLIVTSLVLTSVGVFTSVGDVLARPQDLADAEELGTGLLALREGGRQVILLPVVEHADHLPGRLLVEAHRLNVLIVEAHEGCRRGEQLDPRRRPAVDGSGGFDAVPEARPIDLVELVVESAERHLERCRLDLVVDRPEG